MKTKYIAIKKHDEIPENPISLKKGELVHILRESDPAGDWPNWLFCSGEEKSGWVPMQIVSSEGDHGLLTEDYDATELPLEPGEIILGEKELNGWVWGVKARDSSKRGWAPLNCLEKVPY